MTLEVILSKKAVEVTEIWYESDLQGNDKLCRSTNFYNLHERINLGFINFLRHAKKDGDKVIIKS